ncbi:MAG: sensor histidine kinase [Lachnospiraceae bacterium]|nr:sensor histidine kinase [Lachnospiraceae bacterium]
MDRIRKWIASRKSKPAAWPKNMAVLYLLCIIVPLVATDAIFFALLINSGRVDLEFSYEKAAGNMAFSFGNVLEKASNIAMNITKNDEFHDFLEKDYEGGLDFYEAYNDATNDKFLKALCSINSATYEIYTDNPTIINGGGIYSLERARGLKWYEDYVASGQETYVRFYFDRDSGPITKPSRKLLFISRMGNYPRGRYEKICRIVIDYGTFSRSMESVAGGEDGYIADESRACVFTGGYNNIYDDFTETYDIRGHVGYSRDYVYYGTPFTINIFERADSGPGVIRKNWPIFLIMLAINAVFPIFFAKLTQTVQLGKLKEQEMDIARQQAELLALHSQINPHFLFNALESIRMHSVLKGEDETAEMVEKLAVIERKNADWNDDNTTIENEMDFVDAYLSLQKYRFGDRLSYEIDVDEDCKNAMIPKLTIVTFVENACVHGIEGKSSPGWIFVRVYRKDGNLVIEIEDTGEGIPDEDVEVLRNRMENASIDELKQKGRIGVVNACLRLKIATEGNVRFTIESEKGIGTTIGVMIPKEYVNEKSITC